MRFLFVFYFKGAKSVDADAAHPGQHREHHIRATRRALYRQVSLHRAAAAVNIL
jgi:hypothetical protein